MKETQVVDNKRQQHRNEINNKQQHTHKSESIIIGHEKI